MQVVADAMALETAAVAAADATAVVAADAKLKKS